MKKDRHTGLFPGGFLSMACHTLDPVLEQMWPLLASTPPTTCQLVGLFRFSFSVLLEQLLR